MSTEALLGALTTLQRENFIREDITMRQQQEFSAAMKDWEVKAAMIELRSEAAAPSPKPLATGPRWVDVNRRDELKSREQRTATSGASRGSSTVTAGIMEMQVASYGKSAVVLPPEVVERRRKRLRRLEQALRAELHREELEERNLVLAVFIQAMTDASDVQDQSVRQGGADLSEIPQRGSSRPPSAPPSPTLSAIGTGQAKYAAPSHDSSFRSNTSVDYQQDWIFSPALGSYLTPKMQLYPLAAFTPLPQSAIPSPTRSSLVGIGAIRRGDILAAVDGFQLYSLETWRDFEAQQLRLSDVHFLSIVRQDGNRREKVSVRLGNRSRF